MSGTTPASPADGAREVAVTPVSGIGEVRGGDDLAALLHGAAELRDGDVLVVTSKVVSKAEGRVVALDGSTDRATVLAAETDRVVASRGGTSIVRTGHGLVMAAAGIDASNTAPGTLVLLPADPDGSARALREALGRRGRNVAVLVSDTSGRAWRQGQTDIAVGAAGIEVLDDHAGRDDGYGNTLAVTAPALADEITAAADLATRKLSRSPAAVVRGLADLVLPSGAHGPGARALVRPEETDMFGLGAREAVLAALTRSAGRGFGSPVPAAELVRALGSVLPGSTPAGDGAGGDGRAAGAVVLVVPLASSTSSGPAPHAAAVLAGRAATYAHALGWSWDGDLHATDGDPASTRLRFTRLDP